LIINSLIAVGLSAMILIKDKVREEGGEVDKANILLALGLVFWFIANIIWAYYESVLDIVSPVPSLADLFLLSAYGFLIYRLTIVYRKIGGNYDFWIVGKDNDTQSYEWKKEHNVLTDTKEEENQIVSNEFFNCFLINHGCC
jgi:hypothetical protein